MSTSDQGSAPNPFSRQGSDPSDALGATPTDAPTAPEATTWPTYSYGGYADPTPPAPPANPHDSNPHDSNPYDSNPYGSNPYAANPYDTSPYEVNPYQPSYGGYGAYGIVPMMHPQAVPALVTGIFGLALCPFVGIAGLVLGNKARKAIDAEPGRYTGRGQATAGFVLGIISIVYAVLWVVFVTAGISGAFDN